MHFMQKRDTKSVSPGGPKVWQIRSWDHLGLNLTQVGSAVPSPAPLSPIEIGLASPGPSCTTRSSAQPGSNWLCLTLISFARLV